MPRNVIYFELPASHPDEIIAFYEKPFGWKFKKADLGVIEYWLGSTKDSEKGPGISGGLFRKVRLGDAVRKYVDVESIEDALKSIRELGGTVEMPKTPVPGGFVAHAADPDGNPVGLWQTG